MRISRPNPGLSPFKSGLCQALTVARDEPQDGPRRAVRISQGIDLGIVAAGEIMGAAGVRDDDRRAAAQRFGHAKTEGLAA